MAPRKASVLRHRLGAKQEALKSGCGTANSTKVLRKHRQSGYEERFTVYIVWCCPPPTPPAMVPYAQVRVVSGLVFSPLHPHCGVIVSVGLGFGVCTVVR